MNEGSNEGLCRLKVVIILGHLRAAVLDYVFDERLEEGEERLGFLRVGDEYVGALDDARHKRCNLCSRLQVYTACERQSECERQCVCERDCVWLRVLALVAMATCRRYLCCRYLCCRSRRYPYLSCLSLPLLPTQTSDTQRA